MVWVVVASAKAVTVGQVAQAGPMLRVTLGKVVTLRGWQQR